MIQEQPGQREKKYPSQNSDQNNSNIVSRPMIALCIPHNGTNSINQSIQDKYNQGGKVEKKILIIILTDTNGKPRTMMIISFNTMIT